MNDAQIEAFKTELTQQGYEINERTWEPGTVNHTHAHPFDARGLVIKGSITITHAEGSKRCGPGDEFRLEADIEHEEVIGPEGVTFVSGRRNKA